MQGVNAMLKIVHMIVNDKEVEVAVDDRESLLETLRDRLGLTSVKKGCEVGECGACTVLVDGEAIDSCIYLTMWAEGRRIMTVEGLKGPNGELSTIQKAFVEEAAVQCGFCTPGLIMSAVEIVGTGKKYNREELKKLISVTEKLKKELERIKAVPSGIIRKLPVKRKQPLPVNPTLSNKARKKKRLQTGVAYGRS